MASDVTSTPKVGQPKRGRGRPPKDLTVSPVPPGPVDKPETNQKSYSKRERKPVKRYEYEDSDEFEATDEADTTIDKEPETELLDKNDSSSKKVSATKTIGKGKKRGRPPKHQSDKKNENEDSDELEESDEADTTIEKEADLLDNKVSSSKIFSATKTTSTGKKRGRPPKHQSVKKNDNEVSDDLEASDEADITVEKEPKTDLLDKNDSASKILITTKTTGTGKKRGRPPKHQSKASKSFNDTDTSYQGDGIFEKLDSEKGETELKVGTDTPANVGPKKRGRPKKSENSINGKSKSGLAEHSFNTDDNENSKDTPSRSSRKRRKLNYSTLNDGSHDEADASNLTPTGRKKKRTFVDKSGDEDEDSEGSTKALTSPAAKKPDGRLKKSNKKKVMRSCPKCDKQYDTKQAIQRHAAVEHQLWWTPENPEGDGIERHSLRNIIKIKKYLNCTKCDKRINFPDYYFHHWEWCGREDERYTCEFCDHMNLKAIWKAQHMMTCTALKMKLEEENPRPPKEPESEAEEDGGTGEKKQKKRRAAKKARSMVHDLSKNLADDGDDDFRERKKDPDANVDDDDDDDVDDETDEDEIEEDDDGENDERDEDLEDNSDGERKGSRSQRVSALRDTAGKRFDFSPKEFNKYLDTYTLMLRFMEKNCSGIVFSDWLPEKRQWILLEEKEASIYRPKIKQSLKFTASNDQDLNSLDLYESAIIAGFPVFFTGLSVWKVAWCPVPTKCSDEQYMAVVGKSEQSETFLTTHQTGQGVIQIWNAGSISATRYEVVRPPRFWYNVVHNYGLATEIKWCPSGCYKSNEEKPDSENHQRLGLLAVSFTDGSVRIFSLPVLPAPSEGEIRTYRPSPVASLFPHRRTDKIDISCSCLDWQYMNSHNKILAGYSDGSVRLFNFKVKAAPLCFKSTTESAGMCFLPFQSFHAHGKLVRSVRWLCQQEDVVITACENFDTFIWHLSNTEFPLFIDPPVFMVISAAMSLWHPGIYTGSDDNYAINTNRGRYFEISNISYNALTHTRKDENLFYNFSTQSACIWDVTFSNWLSYVMSCDNRGSIYGMPMADTIRFQIDTKTYKYRQLLLTTEEKQLSKDCLEEEKDIEPCDCEESNCNKCNNIQDTLAECRSSDSQSTTALQSTDQSESVLKNSEDMTSNSNQSGTVPEIKIDSSVKQSENSEDTTSSQSGILTESSNGSTVKQSETYPQPPSNENEKYLKFNEHFKVSCSGLFDSEQDSYSNLTPKSLKALSVNPNHLQCSWLAYAGDAGLVRLANFYKLIPSRGTKHLFNPVPH